MADDDLEPVQPTPQHAKPEPQHAAPSEGAEPEPEVAPQHAAAPDPAAGSGSEPVSGPARFNPHAGPAPRHGAAIPPRPAAKRLSSAAHLDPDAPAQKKGLPLAARVLLVSLAAVIVVTVVGVALYVRSIDEAMSLDEESAAALEEVLATTAADEEAADESDEVEVTDDAADEDETTYDNVEPFYVLIIGSDSRSDDTTGSRADVIMLARVDLANATITFVSIPRDTMISGTVSSIEKINAEYTQGAAAMVAAVEEFAGVDISHYVEVSFSGFKEVVNALGGVWVDIPESFTTHSGTYTFVAGKQLLTGAEALAYCRERYNVSGGDFGRAQAQRQVAEAIITQILESDITEIPGLITTVASAIGTDLTTTEIVSYALQLLASDSELTFYSAACPSYSYNLNGVSYVATEFDEWRHMMQLVDAGLDPNDDEAEIPEEQQANERLGAATNSVAPTDYAYLASVAGLTTDDVASTETDNEATWVVEPLEDVTEAEDD